MPCLGVFCNENPSSSQLEAEEKPHLLLRCRVRREKRLFGQVRAWKAPYPVIGGGCSPVSGGDGTGRASRQQGPQLVPGQPEAGASPPQPWADEQWVAHLKRSRSLGLWALAHLPSG